MIVPLAIWATATALHFALTARAAGRILSVSAATLDERLFASVIGGVASLATALHVASITVGLGLWSGMAALAAWHLLLAWLVRRPQVLTPAAGEQVARASPMEWIALAVIVGVVLTWAAFAAESANINGPDAAHYHVPYAVNLAAGASVFALPATPHLYPMAGSMVAAWFIVPAGDPLIIDLAMVLPWLVMIASLNLIFRCATGLSGLAWASWLGLALFATPMFRASSEGSADLWFASAFVACVAGIAAAWARGRWRSLDVLLLGGAFGLLIGSKTTGVPAAALIGVVALGLGVIRRRSLGPRGNEHAPGIGAWVGAAAACVGAGGIWLVRNWVEFGSPIAPSGLSILGVHVFAGEPFERTTYLSVLGEMGTDAFRLGPRATFFIRQWFGAWYLPALLPIAALVIDLTVQARLWRTDARWWARYALIVLTAIVGATFVWLLIGAPWTALERSRGLTLRYALPIAALLPLLSFAGCFPLAARWYERSVPRRVAATCLVLGSVTLFCWSQRSAEQGTSALVPALRWSWLAIGAAAAIVPRAVQSTARRRLAAVVGFCVWLGWWAPMVARHDAEARGVAQAAFDRESLAYAGGTPPADAWHEPWLALRAQEAAESVRCDRRRFFALTRFDEPLALQPPGYGSVVFYAGRDVDAARRAGPIGPCDYVITTPALEATDKGHALALALAGSRPLRSFALTKDLQILTIAAKP